MKREVDLFFAGGPSFGFPVRAPSSATLADALAEVLQFIERGSYPIRKLTDIAVDCQSALEHPELFQKRLTDIPSADIQFYFGEVFP